MYVCAHVWGWKRLYRSSCLKLPELAVVNRHKHHFPVSFPISCCCTRHLSFHTPDVTEHKTMFYSKTIRIAFTITLQSDDILKMTINWNCMIYMFPSLLFQLSSFMMPFYKSISRYLMDQMCSHVAHYPQSHHISKRFVILVLSSHIPHSPIVTLKSDALLF